jgi:hypothetical protein
MFTDALYRSLAPFREVQRHFQPGNRSNQGLGRITRDTAGAETRPCVCLDDFLGGSLPGSCLIKMDIEGGE